MLNEHLEKTNLALKLMLHTGQTVTNGWRDKLSCQAAGAKNYLRVS